MICARTLSKTADLVILVLLVCFGWSAGPVSAGTATEYRFERLWPALQQPWYFVNTRGIAVDLDDNVFVVDSFNHRLHRFSKDGQLVTRFGQFGIENGQFNFPFGVVSDSLGNIFVSESIGDFRRIQKFNRDGQHLLSFGIFGSGPGEFGDVQEFSPWDMVVDRQGNLLVVGDNRVRIFDANGVFQSEFGQTTSVAQGSSPPNGEFEFTSGLALDAQGNIFVMDGGPSEIQVFDQNGNYLRRFAGFGQAPGLLDAPNDIEIFTEASGVERLLVADANNSRIQKLELDGTPVIQWGQAGSGPGEFLLLYRLAVGRDGTVYAVDTETDSDFGIHRVQKFSSDGTFLSQWSSGGAQPGQFDVPTALALNAAGEVFVADSGNDRIQVFSPTGQFLRAFGDTGSGPGQLSSPVDIDVAPDGRVYVMDFSNQRVQRFDPDGGQPFVFGSPGVGQGQFFHATDLAIGSDGSIYVADFDPDPFDGNVGPVDRISKFSSEGVFQLEWGGHTECFDSMDNPQACVDGAFNQPRGLALIPGVTPAQDVIIVGDYFNRRLQEFDNNGTFIRKRQLINDDLPEEVAVDRSGNVFILPFSDSRLDFGHFFSQIDASGATVASVGSIGSNPGQFRTPTSLAFGPANRAYVADNQNNRIQVFAPASSIGNPRSIIVAGGGPYPGNALWQATQLNANFAYRAQVQQGLRKTNIHYASDDQLLDLDQNGLADDVDSAASIDALRTAILGPSGNGSDGFATGGDELILYLVDHGGFDTFRISGTETMTATTLDGWLDTWQASNPGLPVTVIYDACQSGSFIDELRGPNRLVIASSSPQENAYFVSQGALSFSAVFWTHVFNGLSLGQAFILSRDATAAAFQVQNALIEINGSAPQDDTDLLGQAGNRFIGAGTVADVDAPVLLAGNVNITQPDPMNGSSQTITVTGVADDQGVGRVWVVMTPPGFQPGSPDNPIRDLPSFDLDPVAGSDDYSKTFTGFTESGTYLLSINARDTLGNSSVPVSQLLAIGNPLDRRAVMIVGGEVSDPDFPAFSRNADLVYNALSQQGYGSADASCGGLVPACDINCDSVCYLRADAVLGVDAAASLNNIRDAIRLWGADENNDLQADVQDLTVYLIAPKSGAGYRIGDNGMGGDVVLSAAELNSHLEVAQGLVAGTITVVVDAEDSGAFIQGLTTALPGDRILVASTEVSGTAAMLLGGQVSFSRFFWSQVLNGASVRQAFSQASSALKFSVNGPVPQLDDNNNGMGNELLDGFVSARYTIGSGILLAGDDPLVGGLTVNPVLSSDFETIEVFDVTTTGTIDRVIALVTRPDGQLVSQLLARSGAGYRDRSFGLCGPSGDYEVAVYAIDNEGNTSLPITPAVTINRAVACTDFTFTNGFE